MQGSQATLRCSREFTANEEMIDQISLMRHQSFCLLSGRDKQQAGDDPNQAIVTVIPVPHRKLQYDTPTHSQSRQGAACGYFRMFLSIIWLKIMSYWMAAP
jgi:hypothetical protein